MGYLIQVYRFKSHKSFFGLDTGNHFCPKVCAHENIRQLDKHLDALTEEAIFVDIHRYLNQCTTIQILNLIKQWLNQTIKTKESVIERFYF